MRVATALACIAAGLLQAQEPITETHPDGSPFRVYRVDAQGRKDGRLEQFSSDGTLELRAIYQAGELHGLVERFYPDGKPQVRALYDKGRRHGLWREWGRDGRKVAFKTFRYDVLDGPCTEFLPDGNPRVVARYRNGILDGRHQLFDPARDWQREAHYKEGKLHGKVTIKHGSKTASRQWWEGGALVELDGMRPFPRSFETLKAKVGEILSPETNPTKTIEPSVGKSAKKPGRRPLDKGEAPAADPKGAERAAALRRLQAYRYLCGLRWEDMALSSAMNDMCDAAAEVCQAIGRLDHTPPRPPGFDAERYRLGYRGASHSNLAGGGDMAHSVDMYMDDSDRSNIDRIGHRRWCLNPGMKFTGFGSAGRWSAMWSMDASGAPVTATDAVYYPPPGKVPVDLFGGGHAWSISVLRGGAVRKSELRVVVRELDEYYEATGKPLELDHFGIAGGGYGTGTCIVFRPVGVRVQDGAGYLVEVSSDGGKKVLFRYVVEFCPAVGRLQ